ncbi:unnamed protein product [Lathyrus oleraceus]
MGSLNTTKNKPHVVCIPYPAQGHINPMLKLAKLLHFKGGFHVTFVNTEYNHKRLLKSRGPNSLNGLSSFRFETIPDGLPETDVDVTQDIPSLCDSTRKTCLPHFKKLLAKLNNAIETPPVTCIVSDGCMSFTLDAAQELNIPEVLFWTTSACGFMAYTQYSQLVERGLTPLKDSSYMTNGYLETTIDWIPGIKEIRLKDIPSFIRTTQPNDLMVHFLLEVTDKELNSFGSNLWKEEPECLEWLNSKEPNSVVYVNFGSITVMTNDQMIEFAWGLANSKIPFLWVIRPDLVAGENSVLPQEFLEETKNRGMLSSWCPQEEVLDHSAIGGFLTHSGWNSTLESVCGGVPMICWPFFAEQQTNCRFCCHEWGIGLEIEDAKRDKIESLVKEMVEGGKGKEMKEKALEWKKLAQNAASGPNGSSFMNLEKMFRDVLL